MRRKLTASPMKSGSKGNFANAAVIAAMVLPAMENTDQSALRWPGQKTASVRGRKMPPPRSPIER